MPPSHARGSNGIDYTRKEFEWTKGLKAKMMDVFGIGNFRLCQEGVCNANMDGRDIVCVMPTGGGKSLTYQLPALLQPGCTVVISPLLSLITDQILHLQESGVQAVKITSATSKQESFEITQRLTALAGRKVTSRDEEIKLCYVTPERIAKSKTFVSLLQKLDASQQLARFVIDEAHCVSQLGHDFRPDYAKLHVLRKLFPHVPIMALSATCPPKVLDNLISTLGLGKVEDGKNAPPRGTVYFTAPLYRKNLHYSVVPKLAKSSEVLQAMTTYILDHHADHSGIVYCLSKKDAETVAQGLREISGGRIKTGVYHADRHDGDKEGLHLAWRNGTVKVVCATIGELDISFGLGIDKADVRFVLHHSISKSLEGFYQESGRAGRDGKDSDCVLYYRPQDGMTLSSMVAGEKEGTDKLYAMLKFAQNLDECRKTQFANYFSIASEVAISAWTTAESDALSRCFRGANVTLNNLATLARGNLGGEFEVQGKGGKGKMKEKQKLDLEEVAGGKVDLTKDEIEHILVDLLLKEYLAEKYWTTSYSTNVYIVCGPLAPILFRHTQRSLANARDVIFESVFRRKARKSKGSGEKSKSPSNTKAAGKRKRDTTDSEDDERETIDIDEDVDNDNGEVITEAAVRHSVPRTFIIRVPDTDEDDMEDEEDDEWSMTFRKKGLPPRKKPRNSATHGKIVKENDREVLILSD
ncbi:ATP-dependent DNA helicase Q-like 2 [Termitomyces sp. J132]|nr:ATP-dependent DNA helicase Q-like 2 [Termitomyces sp. J132]